MRPHIRFYSSRNYEIPFYKNHKLAEKFELDFYEGRLDPLTASTIPQGAMVCAFATDNVGTEVLKVLHDQGVSHILLRSAGFNHVDLPMAKKLGLKIARVPAYSPESVAEHTVALILTLVRKTHKAYNRVREGNFSLEGLVGMNLYQKTFGLVGTGKIGMATAKIMLGLGMKVLAYDPFPNKEIEKLGITYISLEELFSKSDIISLHCPLNEKTHHLINEKSLKSVKDGAIIVNTGRGGLIDTKAIIQALKAKKISGLALDVYEEEEQLFFQDHSQDIIDDDIFGRLLTFPNVLITGHQAFLTKEALQNIADTTLENALAFIEERVCPNLI